MNAHAAPPSMRRDEHERHATIHGDSPPSSEAEPRAGEPAHEQLTLGADVEQPGAEAVGDGRGR